MDQWVFDGQALMDIQIEFRKPLDWSGGGERAYESMVSIMHHDPEFFVDVIDWCAGRCRDSERLATLEQILESGASVYRVGIDPNGLAELQDRVAPTVAAAVTTAATPGRAAERHLATAWSNVYGRTKNPSHGYREAIKAIECVASPIVIPEDGGPTLGKILAAMKAKPEKWTSVFTPPAGVDPIHVVIGDLELLWKSQDDRHGVPGSAPPIVVSQSEAESAIHLAAALVHLFDSGAIRLA